MATAAFAEGLFTERELGVLIMIVILSMAISPMLYAGVMSMRQADSGREFDKIDAHDSRVIIAGFGRFAQIIGRTLASQKIPFTALESSAAQVDFVRAYGNKVFYGDVTQADLLIAAGIATAKALVVAVDDADDAVHICEIVSA